tara:strand:- start:3110 stop:4762 length:1653 start_codon:yes stop_codon:yes gene_type:complete
MTTHAGRSLLEETNRFSNEGKAVGEYVKNSWQYSDKVNHNPTVEIMVDQENKSIQIKDDSNGMSIKKINEQFLVLNQENEERREGDFGRGEYGTGKIAGLGIGQILSVRTVKDNKLNRFEIHREDCKASISKEGVQVRWKDEDIQTSEKNGTIINILGFRQKRPINTTSIKKFLQTKTLTETVYKKEINLFLQAEKLEKIEIPFEEEEIIQLDENYKKILGETRLVIRIATRKLDDEERGINVLARGIHKAFVKNPTARYNEFIFGTCECDKLIDEDQDPPIFDSSRREELNEDNLLAQKFKEFVSVNVDKIRKKLEKRANESRQKEKEEALKKEAEKMKNFFNDDYKNQELELQKRAAKARGNIDEKEKDIPSLGDTKIVVGKDFNVNVIDGDDNAGIYDGSGDGEGGEGGDNGKAGGKLDRTDQETTEQGKERKSKKKKSGGGFDFKFDHLGKDDHRAKYDDDSRVITINLDHPFLKRIEEMAGGDQKSSTYMRPAFEAAIFEYAAAVTTQKGNSNMLDDALSDGVIEMQERVDTLLKKLAALDYFND